MMGFVKEQRKVERKALRLVALMGDKWEGRKGQWWEMR